MSPKRAIRQNLMHSASHVGAPVSFHTFRIAQRRKAEAGAAAGAQCDRKELLNSLPAPFDAGSHSRLRQSDDLKASRKRSMHAQSANPLKVSRLPALEAEKGRPFA